MPQYLTQPSLEKHCIYCYINLSYILCDYLIMYKQYSVFFYCHSICFHNLPLICNVALSSWVYIF